MENLYKKNEYRVNIGKAAHDWNYRRQELRMSHESFAIYILKQLVRLQDIEAVDLENMAKCRGTRTYSTDKLQQKQDAVVHSTLKSCSENPSMPVLRKDASTQVEIQVSTPLPLTPSYLRNMCSSSRGDVASALRNLTQEFCSPKPPILNMAAKEVPFASSPIGTPIKETNLCFDFDESEEEEENYSFSTFEDNEEYSQLVIELEDSIDVESVSHDEDNHHDRKMAVVDFLQLSQLVKKAYGSVCRCGSPLDQKVATIGSALTFAWACPKGNSKPHRNGRWSSQLMYEGVYSGNLAIACGILLSGNDFAKIAQLFEFSNILLMGSNTFYRYQRFFIHPAVKSFWGKKQAEAFQQINKNELVLAGDGRNDSPGHTAQYCTYVLAEINTKLILSCVNIDVREAEGKSVNMELIGFRRGVEEIIRRGCTIKEIVTDAHIQIGAEFKRNTLLSNVFHSWDVWHGAKNIFKKITEASHSKQNEALAKWAREIRNHFWYCSEVCDGDIRKMKLYWLSLLKHVTNDHVWKTDLGIGTSCGHVKDSEEEVDDPEHEEKEWLQADSQAFSSLRTIVMDQRLLKQFYHYKNYRHTGWLESFNNNILSYTTKRESRTWIGYETRIMLAAIDHNVHVHRAQATKKDGSLQFKHCFSKRKNEWIIKKLYEKKTYPYIGDLKKEIFHARQSFEGNMKQTQPLGEDDPRRLFHSRGLVEKPNKEAQVLAYLGKISKPT